jgi:hypothetical protein
VAVCPTKAIHEVNFPPRKEAAPKAEAPKTEAKPEAPKVETKPQEAPIAEPIKKEENNN